MIICREILIHHWHTIMGKLQTHAKELSYLFVYFTRWSQLFLKGTTDYVPKIPDWLQLQCWKAVPDTGAGGKSDRPTSRSINIKHILSILHGCTMLQCQFLRYQAITATSYPIIFKRPQKHVLHLEHVYLSHILVSTTFSSSFMTSTYNL